MALYRGPSPRVWGKHLQPLTSQLDVRTIPTRVGKTDKDREGAGRFADHPHACGENEPMGIDCLARNGPSPRVWGKLSSILPSSVSGRTIPTRVGKTGSIIPFGIFGTDHPHACGENK